MTPTDRVPKTVLPLIMIVLLWIFSPAFGASPVYPTIQPARQVHLEPHQGSPSPPDSSPESGLCVLPSLENRMETEHFILRWTNLSSRASDNIPHPDVVRETAGYLETARSKYISTFGRSPFAPHGSGKIEVVFLSLECFGEADPPEGPIRFDAQSWMKKPGIRRPTSAHELFHKMQYAFGYRTKWKPREPFLWFTEGTAAWAETFVWQQVSSRYKLQELFRSPSTPFYESDDSAAPFWLFFQNHCRFPGRMHPVAELFHIYEKTGDEREALATIIGRSPGPMAHSHNTLSSFFADFARKRHLGKECRTSPFGGSRLLSPISDPDGITIQPSLRIFEAPLQEGKEYTNHGEVPELGSGYYRFTFTPAMHGRTVKLRISGEPEGNTTCFVGWEHNGQWNSDIQPTSIGLYGKYSFAHRIQPGDSLMLIISGTNSGGTYSIKASVS